LTTLKSPPQAAVLLEGFFCEKNSTFQDGRKKTKAQISSLCFGFFFQNGAKCFLPLKPLSIYNFQGCLSNKFLRKRISSVIE
jgi:hypothetical protein